jgi:hypothetical protein
VLKRASVINEKQLIIANEGSESEEERRLKVKTFFIA